MAFPSYGTRITTTFLCVTTGREAEATVGPEALFVVQPNGPEPEDRYPQVWATVPCPACGMSHSVYLGGE